MDLQSKLQQLSPEELRALLSASGHGQLLRQQQEDAKEVDGQAAAAAKDEGNAFFRQGRMQEAIAAYSKCIQMDPSNAVCLSNRAAAYLKLKQYESAIADCARAIELAPSIKPLMRRATASIALQQFNSAVDDLSAALEFEPRNKECRKKLETIVDHATDPSKSAPPMQLRRAGIRAAIILTVCDGWTQFAVRGNPGPAAVNGHTLFLDDEDHIYLFGGRAVREQTPSVFVRDENDFSSWDNVPVRGTDAPSSRAWHSTSPIGTVGTGCYCIYGGVSSKGEDPQIYLLTPVSPRGFRWVSPRYEQDSKEIPAPRSGHAAVSVLEEGNGGQVVYIFGGRTKQGVSNQLLLLKCLSTENDPPTMEWTEIGAHRKDENAADWPCARDGHSMCLLDGSRAQASQLILFGGNGQNNNEKMNDVWLFGLKDKRWTSLECSGEIPPPRSYHTVHTIAGFLVVVGGRTVDCEDDSIYLLDVCTAEWFKVPTPKGNTLNPRAWHSSVLTRTGQLFVLGGGTYHGPLKSAATIDLSYFQTKASKLNVVK